MKSQALHRSLPFAGLVCVLALSVTNCSDELLGPAASAGSSGEAGEGGEAGSSPIGMGEAGAAPVVICGQSTTADACDPVTGAPCDLAGGETCDQSVSFGGYKCFPGPNPAGPGEYCDSESLFCGAKTRCVFDEPPRCDHYCCKDADCEHGTCATGMLIPETLGVCLDEFPNLGAGGAMGMGGAADAAGASGAPELGAGAGGTSG